MDSRRLIVSREALSSKLGSAASQNWQDLGGKTVVVSDDVAAHELASVSDVILLDRPESWSVEATHGSLFVRPGEYYLSPVRGCRSLCSYCFLRAEPFLRLPIVAFANLDNLHAEVMNQIESAGGQELLFSTGELADSLGEISWFPMARELVRLFRRIEGARLELRTKQARVDQFVPIDHGDRTTVAFSLVPTEFGDLEVGTANVSERLEAAHTLLAASYPVAIKFEPIVPLDGWRDCYESLVTRLCRTVGARAIEHVSLGALRWSSGLGSKLMRVPSLRPIIADGLHINHKPGHNNFTLDRETRIGIYLAIGGMLRTNGFDGPIYLSLEESSVIEELSGVLHDRRLESPTHADQ